MLHRLRSPRLSALDINRYARWATWANWATSSPSFVINAAASSVSRTFPWLASNGSGESPLQSRSCSSRDAVSIQSWNLLNVQYLSPSSARQDTARLWHLLTGGDEHVQCSLLGPRISGLCCDLSNFWVSSRVVSSCILTLFSTEAWASTCRRLTWQSARLSLTFTR